MSANSKSYHSILSNLKIRLLIGLLSGIIFKLLVDIVFGLIYRNYSIFKPWHSYIGVVLLTLTVFQCFYYLSKWLDRKTPWEKSPQKRFFKQFIWHSIISLAFFSIIRWTVEVLFLDRSFMVFKNEFIIMLSTLIITLIFNFIELAIFLLYKWRYSLAELERFKKENAEFKFETLRNQVNPHFLFNSLNTLSSVMYENVDTAAKYIRQLSTVYRYVLENRQKELIELKSELEFIKSYKYLFELRFTNRLSINISDACNNNTFIAPMTIQMLIENAVKHNIISEKKPLHININCTDNYIVVENNLQKKAPEGYSSGMGLQNISNRYQFLTQREVKIIDTDKVFRVEIPLIICP